MNGSLRTRLLLGIGVTTAVEFLLTAVILYMQMRRGLLAEFNGKLTPESRVFHVMVKQDGYQIVWCWGSESEELKAQQLNKDNIGYVLLQRLTIPQLCNLFRQSFAVVAADTGILHLASAVGAPTVSFWGPTPRWRNAPHAKHDQYVESNVM